MRIVTPESLKSLKGKPNEVNCAKHINDVSASVRHKPIIRNKSEMDWHKLPKSLMRKPNKADYTKHINNMTVLMKCKLTIWNIMHHSEKECTSNSNVKSLTFLLKRIVVAITTMKKTHKKSAPILMNLV